MGLTLSRSSPEASRLRKQSSSVSCTSSSMVIMSSSRRQQTQIRVSRLGVALPSSTGSTGRDRAQRYERSGLSSTRTFVVFCVWNSLMPVFWRTNSATSHGMSMLLILVSFLYEKQAQANDDYVQRTEDPRHVMKDVN